MGIPTWASPAQPSLSQSSGSMMADPVPFKTNTSIYNRHYPASMTTKTTLTAPYTPRSSTPSKFPVHRIEESPILAHYQTKGGCDVTERGGRKGVDLDSVSLLPRCRPEDVLFKVKSVRFQDDSKGDFQGGDGTRQKKMVDLTSLDQAKEVEVTTRSHVRNLLPTSTMVMEKDPDLWYRKFSRNLHGLRKEKPYSNLTWPPQ